MAAESDTRDLRWNLRVAESEDELVRAASESVDASFTSFVRSAAVTEARRVLADRERFEIPVAEADLGELFEDIPDVIEEIPVEVASSDPEVAPAPSAPPVFKVPRTIRIGRHGRIQI